MQLISQKLYGNPIILETKDLYILKENTMTKTISINTAIISFASTVSYEKNMIQDSFKLQVNISS